MPPLQDLREHVGRLDQSWFAGFIGPVCKLCWSCLQALLEEWRSELARKPLAMTEKEACSVLGVQPEEGQDQEGQDQDQEGPLSEDALKAAYRQAAPLCPQSHHAPAVYSCDNPANIELAELHEWPWPTIVLLD